MHLAIYGYKAQFGSNKLTMERFSFRLVFCDLLLYPFLVCFCKNIPVWFFINSFHLFAICLTQCAARRARTHAQEPLFTVVIDFHSGHHHPHPFAINLNIVLICLIKLLQIEIIKNYTKLDVVQLCETQMAR